VAEFLLAAGTSASRLRSYWEKEGDIRANGYHNTVIGLGASHAGLRNGSFDNAYTGPASEDHWVYALLNQPYPVPGKSHLQQASLGKCFARQNRRLVPL